MNNRTEQILEEYKPVVNIVVYGTASKLQYYLESHSFNEEGCIMEGKPLEQDTIQGIVDVFFDENKNRQKIEGLFPDNLLSFRPAPGGRYQMMWWRPAEIKFIHLNEKLKIPSGSAWVPPMIYISDGKQLWVYALLKNERPDEATKLYRAPFYNVSADGVVCLGSGKLKAPKNDYAAIMKYWEDYFWLTEFTHLSGSNATKTNVTMLWQKLVGDNTIKWESLDELLCSNKTIKSLLR